MKILFTAATESLTTGAIDREQIEREYEKNRAAYFALPLEEMCPAESELKAVLTEAAALISEL